MTDETPPPPRPRIIWYTCPACDARWQTIEGGSPCWNCGTNGQTGSRPVLMACNPTWEHEHRTRTEHEGAA